MRKVVGVSYGYHDSSVALVVDGRVVAAAAEERLTRQKHDPNFPTFAIGDVLRRGGVKLDEVDEIVFHEDPHAKFARVLTTALAPYPRSRKEFVNSMKAWLGRKLWSLPTLASRLDVDPSRVSYLSHHFSHAVQAFMGSGFRESGIMVVDAVGDWACTALYKGRWVDGRPQVERILEVGFPNSLGLVYSAVTAFLGFSPNDSECSTMALAAFGRPTYVDAMRRVVAEADDGLYDVDQSYFHFADFYKGAFSAKFVEVFGTPRPFAQKLPFRSMGAQPAINADHQRWADVAYAVQAVLEERLLALAGRLKKEFPVGNVCLAGGVSLNCVANGKLLRSGLFENFFVPPDPGDGGTAVGVALYADAVHDAREPATGTYGPYLGPAHDPAPDVEMIRLVKPDHIKPYLKRGLEGPARYRFESRTYETVGALVEDVSQRLMDRQIVGWVQGAAELGPRALGNRSILVRPDDVELAWRLSRDVKDRAGFRPYAFSVREEDAVGLLEADPAHLPFLRWMQFSASVKPSEREKVAAALHVDGSTRPQVVTADANPPYHALLTAFGARFGRGVLLNTSFNPSGYPIVTTPAEALMMFARTGMDALVLGNSVVWKHVDG